MLAGDNNRIIFIVGRSRSGTNLIRSILNLHPEIWISQEPKFFSQGRHKGIIKTISHLYPFDNPCKIEEIFSIIGSGEVAPSFWTNKKLNLNRIKSEFESSEKEYRDLIRISLKVRGEAEGRLIFGEKTPSNLYKIPILMDWFPNARFIHIIRDPRAVFVSEINRLPRPHYLLQRSNAMSRLIIFCYISVDWLRNIKIYNKFSSERPENYLLTKFRVLITDRELEVKKICNFLGVDFNEAMLNPQRRGSNFTDEYDPLIGWENEIPFVYNYLFRLFLGRKIKKYS